MVPLGLKLDLGGLAGGLGRALGAPQSSQGKGGGLPHIVVRVAQEQANGGHGLGAVEGHDGSQKERDTVHVAVVEQGKQLCGERPSVKSCTRNFTQETRTLGSLGSRRRGRRGAAARLC